MRFASYYEQNQPVLGELAGIIRARATAAGCLVVRQESPYSNAYFSGSTSGSEPGDESLAASMLAERLQFTTAVAENKGSALQQQLYDEPGIFFGGSTLLHKARSGRVDYADYAFSNGRKELLGHTYRVERQVERAGDRPDDGGDQVSLMVIAGLVCHIQHDALSRAELSFPIPMLTVPMTMTLPPPSPEGLNAIRAIIEG